MINIIYLLIPVLLPEFQFCCHVEWTQDNDSKGEVASKRQYMSMQQWLNTSRDRIIPDHPMAFSRILIKINNCSYKVNMSLAFEMKYSLITFATICSSSGSLCKRFTAW